MPTKEFKLLSEIIADLYEAAVDPTLWPTLATKIAAAFQADSAQLQFRPDKNSVQRLTQTANYTPEHIAQYKSYYFKNDLWVQKSMLKPLGIPFRNMEILSDSEMRHSEFYGWCKTLNIYQMLGATIPVDSNGALAIVGIHRPENKVPFNAADNQKLALLVPHIRKAMHLRTNIISTGQAHATNLAALEALSIGVFVTDANGKLLFENPVSSKLLSESVALSSNNGRIKTCIAALTNKLLQLINTASKTFAAELSTRGGHLSIPIASGGSIRLFICPLPKNLAEIFFTETGAIIFTSDTRKNCYQSITMVLKMIYGLTHAEALLLESLISGSTIKEYAEKRRSACIPLKII